MKSYNSFYSLQLVALVSYFFLAIILSTQTRAITLQPEDMPDPDDFDEEDTLEEGLTELDRRRHVSKKEDLDLIEDEDDSFVDELDEEE